MTQLADECKKLLDNGWTIQLYRNDLDSYTAAALPPKFLAEAENHPFVDDDDIPEPNEQWITDDFEPSKALYRLTEKVLTGRIVDSND